MKASRFQLSHFRSRKAIAIAMTTLIALAISVYAAAFCVRNKQVRGRWDEWTAHLTGPPSSWSAPSNELRRFDSETHSFRSKSGLVLPLWGYKDNAGAIVIEPRFSACAERFYDGVAWASDPAEKRSGYINPDGSWAIVVPGATHSDFIGGMGRFQVDGDDGWPRYGFVNRAGVVIAPAKYYAASWYVDGYTLVEERTWVGAILDGLGVQTGVSLNTCWNTRVLVLDELGQRVSLPRMRP